MYFAVKHSHMLIVLISVFLLIFRFVLQCRHSPLIDNKVLKILPHIIDTLLLVTAAVLMMTIEQYPFQAAWLTEKLFFVIAYIALGFVALKFAQTIAHKSIALVAALFCLATTAHLAISKQPLILNI